MHRAARQIVLPAAVLLALTACTADGGQEPEPPVADAETEGEVEAADPGPGTGEVAVTATVVLQGAELEAEVYPVVRAGDHAVLTIDLSHGEPERVSLSTGMGGLSPILMPTLSGLRLVDLDADQVHTVAVNADGRTVTTAESYVNVEPEGLRLQVAYAAPGPEVESLGLFLPGAPYVASVPVMDGDVPDADLPGSTPGDEVTEPLGLDEIAEAPVASLESFTRELEGAVSTLTTTEEVQITLGADVLFDVDSADLTDQAQAALDAAAAHLNGREPGTVEVVGHTDDVGPEDHNQDLSERRAESVAAALRERVDTSAYPLETSGRGESEPVAPGTDDASRQQNRRVALTLVSEITQSTEVTAGGELPEFDGPTGTGPDGVTVDADRGYSVAAPQARRIDGHLVVDLEVTPLDEEQDATGLGFLSGVWHHRETAWTAQYAVSALTVLIGDTAVFPVDYLAGEQGEHELWLPVSDLHALGDIDGGTTRTLSVVYPDVGPVEDVTVQLRPSLGNSPFRLTDVPVAD
ncbi:OmpA family protein [Actinotalea sp. C106]|uniref:OmpA family protein n=1 Tax=Actinotalea sp. C106 TaxID=2908644 RepID=UPI0020293D40|nr:OmpA family protein [Actinotalea sp. C106]